MTLHHAYFIKGWLLGREVPQEVAESLNAVIAALTAVRVVTSPSTDQPGATERFQECVTRIASALEPLAEREPPTTASVLPLLTVGDTVMLPGGDSMVVAGSVTAPSIKSKRNWSPEQREAAAERMRAMRAAKLGKPRPAGTTTP